MSTPSPMHGSNGPPGPGGLPPPHNTMTPTPPAQGHTPAPSPGPQILGKFRAAHFNISRIFMKVSSLIL